MTELEFLPADYIRSRFQRRVRFIRSWLLLAVGLAMVLWSLQTGVSVRDARAELRVLQGQNSAVAADVAKVQMLRDEAQGYNRRLGLLAGLTQEVTATGIISDLVAALPDGMVLEACDVDYPEDTRTESPKVRVRGMAVDATASVQVLSALDASPRFEQPILVESKAVPGMSSGRRSFVVEARVVTESATEEK